MNVWESGIAAGACGCMGKSIAECTKVGLCEPDKKLFRAMVGHTQGAVNNTDHVSIQE